MFPWYFWFLKYDQSYFRTKVILKQTLLIVNKENMTYEIRRTSQYHLFAAQKGIAKVTNNNYEIKQTMDWK